MSIAQLIIWWIVIALLWIFQKSVVRAIQTIVKKDYHPTAFIVYICILAVVSLSILVYTLQVLQLRLFLHFFLFLIVLLVFFAFLYSKNLFYCLAGWLYITMNEEKVKDKELNYNNEHYTVRSISWLSCELVDRKETVKIVPNSVFLESHFEGKPADKKK